MDPLQRTRPSDGVELPFKAGDKVYDTWDNVHIIIKIDREAVHGIGIIHTQRERDGVKLGHSVIAHDLTVSKKRAPN